MPPGGVHEEPARSSPDGAGHVVCGGDAVRAGGAAPGRPRARRVAGGVPRESARDRRAAAAPHLGVRSAGHAWRETDGVSRRRRQPCRHPGRRPRRRVGQREGGVGRFGERDVRRPPAPVARARPLEGPGVGRARSAGPMERARRVDDGAARRGRLVGAVDSRHRALGRRRVGHLSPARVHARQAAAPRHRARERARPLRSQDQRASGGRPAAGAGVDRLHDEGSVPGVRRDAAASPGQQRRGGDRGRRLVRRRRRPRDDHLEEAAQHLRHDAEPARRTGGPARGRCADDDRQRRLLARHAERSRPRGRHPQRRNLRRAARDARLGRCRLRRLVVASGGGRRCGDGRSAARRAAERADPRHPGAEADSPDRAEAGRVRLRPRAEHGGLVPPRGPREGRRDGQAPPRGDAGRRGARSTPRTCAARCRPTPTRSAEPRASRSSRSSPITASATSR